VCNKEENESSCVYVLTITSLLGCCAFALPHMLVLGAYRCVRNISSSRGYKSMDEEVELNFKRDSDI